MTEPLFDPYATAVLSPVAAVRLPAIRDRETLAFQVLGRTRRGDGTLRRGTAAERRVARTWLGGAR